MNRQTLVKKKLPDAPGVYFFLGRNRKILYIGRATSLRNRVRSYFDGRLLETRGPWLEKMFPLIRSIDVRKTDSVLEAILLEADLIKKFQPPYNTDDKDDKSFNSVVITKEAFPAVFIERSRNIDFLSLRIKDKARPNDSSVGRGLRILAVYGPFTNGFDLRVALKLVRRIFPYRDLKCTPCSEQQKPHKQHTDKLGFVSMCKPCFNRQIGLCPGTCTGEISKEEYSKTIRNIRLFFEGKKTRLVSLLKREMKAAAKAQEFEKAGERKRTIFALQHIQDVALLGNWKLEIGNSPQPFRVEGYDLSHFIGKEFVGAMTVVEDGRAVPSEYRLFKLRSISEAHEVKGLEEVLRRRFNHPEWPFPNLIVVDGNEVQKSAAEKLLASLGQTIPVVAVVKDERHRPRDVLGLSSLRIQDKGLRIPILLANSEAHRFVLAFQKKRRIATWK